MADTSSNNSKSSWFSGWFWKKAIAFLVAGGAAVISLIFLYLKMRKQGEELAKLQHDKDVADEQKREALANAALAKNDDEAKKLQADAEQLRLKVADLNYQAEKVATAQKATREKIDAAKDWSELDSLMSSSK